MQNHTVAFICPSTSWGGLEMNVFRLARWLTRRGHKIILYGNPSSILFENCHKADIPVRSLISRSKFGDLFLSFSLATALKRDKARIVMLHMNKNFLLTAEAKKISKRFFKFIYMQHMHVGPDKNDIYHDWLYGHLDSWIAPLPMFKQAVTEKTNIPPHKIEIIPLGIELAKFTENKPDKMTARQRLDLPESAIIAGVVGRLDPKKGQHILIEACRILRDKEIQLHLLFVGESSMNEQTGYENHLIQLVDKYNLGPRVHFRKFIPEVEYAYAAMDIFALTSKSETYGMVTLEAMASGIPVIGTRDGGTVDIIEHDTNGLLVEPYNPEELAGALSRFINDKDLARQMASRAKADVIARYSHEYQCELLEDLFGRLTAGQVS